MEALKRGRERERRQLGLTERERGVEASTMYKSVCIHVSCF